MISPSPPGAKTIATGREVSALASKLLVREIEAHGTQRNPAMSPGQIT